MTGPDTALFGFRVGGVQEFIDSARTTEDFWASSYLISHLTQQAAEVVTAELGADCLIFPSAQAFGRAAAGPDGPQTEADLRIAQFPNGILAEVPRARAANGLGLEIEERFHGAWRSTMDAVRSVLERTFALQSGEARAIWERQAGRRTFETFWAWTPWDRGGGEEYMVAYQRLSALLEARKLLRDFEAGGEGEPHTKCTQCGKLQALQNFDHFSEKDAKTFWEELAGQENYRVKFRFRRSERLCAVCATCRMASRSPAFGGAGVDLRRAQPSTSSIAVAPFLKAVFAECLDYLDILEELARNAKAVAGAAGLGLLEESPYRGLNLGNWEDYPYLSELQHLDGDWFFKSSYDNGHFTQVKPQAIVDEGLLRAARKSLEKLYEVVKKGNESKGMTPSAYVALVKLDGDEVGEWIGGNRAGRADIAGHRALSAALGRIGAAARPIVEDVLMGRLIYSGGDDLLFLMPVANLVGGIGQVLEAIKRGMGPGYEQFRFSGAALVMPHSDSLSGAIREVEELLRSEAKEKYGRDAIVVTARRQSGQRTQAAIKSRDCAALQSLISALAKKEYETGAVSSRIASQLSLMVEGLDGHQDTAALEDMSLYLLGRHGGGAVSAELREAMIALTDAAAELAPRNAGNYVEQTLLTARFLERSETNR